MISLAMHRIQIQRYSGLCDRAEPEFWEVQERQASALIPIRSGLVSLSKELGGSSVRMYFYGGDPIDTRRLVTEDIDISLPNHEDPLPRIPLPVGEDDFYLDQLDQHNNGGINGGYFVKADNVDEGVLRDAIAPFGINYIASAPIIGSDGYPVGYIEIRFKTEPTASESAVLQQMYIEATNIADALD